MSPKKNILVDIGHPAHVHLFKYFIRAMKTRGHQVFVLTKNVDSITRLLKIYEIPYTTVGVKPNSIFLKYLFQISIILKTILFIRKNKIDIGIGISMTLPIVARFTGIPTIGMDDDDVSITPVYAKFINKSDTIITPDALAHEKRGLNHIAVPSYHELAYLHPRRFMPDPAVLSEAGIKHTFTKLRQSVHYYRATN
jgi:predicted glycosyltransferase